MSKYKTLDILTVKARVHNYFILNSYHFFLQKFQKTKSLISPKINKFVVSHVPHLPKQINLCTVDFGIFSHEVGTIILIPRKTLTQTEVRVVDNIENNIIE
jgi:hypothetical protein